MKKVNIADFFGSEANNTLELIKIGSDEVALILFTFDGEQINLHYGDEPEIAGYVHCNGSDCVFCRVGKKASDKILLPGYLPASRQIGVLPVSTSLQPNALLPQLGAIEEADKEVGLFISKEGRFRFVVSTFELKEDTDRGEEIIARFKKDYEEGKIDLGGVYQRLSNEQLQQVPGIERLLKLKGLVGDADNPAA